MGNHWRSGLAGVAATAAVIAGVLMLTRMTSASQDHSSSSHAPLTLGSYASGPAPGDGYLAGSEFRTKVGRVNLALPAGMSVTEVAVLRGGFLASASDETGNETVHLLAADGSALRSWDVASDSFFPTLVVSSDRTLGAFVDVTGTSVVVEDGGRTVTRLPAATTGSDSPAAPVAVTGTTCAGAGADCEVLVHVPTPVAEGGSLKRTWLARPGQPAEVADLTIGEVRAVAADGRTAGKTKVIEDGDGACAAVAEPAGAVLWQTCKDRMIAFSPDSELLLASTSALWGSGDHELTILDAATGAERLRLKTAENVGIYEMAWENDDHVLAVVSDWKVDRRTEEHVDVRWAVLRVSVDGAREYAVEPIAGTGEDFDGPFDLPRS